MERIIIGIVFLISVLISISVNKNFKVYRIFKPLTTILVILTALLSNFPLGLNYKYYIVSALIFSLIGDIFLLREKYFVQGLVSFLLAHLVFSYAFISLEGFSNNFIVLLLLLIFGGSYYYYLKPGLKQYSLPVAIYLIAIIFMNWQAIGLFFKGGNNIYLFIGIASLLFTFSDSVIAFKKFKRPFKAAEVLILSTYWAAIYIFASSCFYIGK